MLERKIDIVHNTTAWGIAGSKSQIANLRLANTKSLHFIQCWFECKQCNSSNITKIHNTHLNFKLWNFRTQIIMNRINILFGMVVQLLLNQFYSFQAMDKSNWEYMQNANRINASSQCHIWLLCYMSAFKQIWW